MSRSQRCYSVREIICYSSSPLSILTYFWRCFRFGTSLNRNGHNASKNERKRTGKRKRKIKATVQVSTIAVWLPLEVSDWKDLSVKTSSVLGERTRRWVSQSTTWTLSLEWRKKRVPGRDSEKNDSDELTRWVERNSDIILIRMLRWNRSQRLWLV